MTNNNISNVVQLGSIKPKQTKAKHKQVPITITYNPVTKQWDWEIVIVTEAKFSNTADTEKKAYLAAQRYIDKNGLGK